MYAKEICTKTNITTHALRHYIELGLLSPKKNPKNGYYDFSHHDAETILFIKKAKELGFTLPEIKTFDEDLNASECKHQSSLPHLISMREDITKEMKRLQTKKRTLTKLINSFQQKNCTIKSSRFKL